MIDVDLPEPDSSDAKLQAVSDTVLDLVSNGVFETDLTTPLDFYVQEWGGIDRYWADVALHKNYSLPFGRLDPENETHHPWIALWQEIHAVVLDAMKKYPPEKIDDFEDEPIIPAMAGNNVDPLLAFLQ